MSSLSSICSFIDPITYFWLRHPEDESTNSPLHSLLRPNTRDKWISSCVELFGDKAQTHLGDGRLTMYTFLNANVNLLHYRFCYVSIPPPEEEWIKIFFLRTLKEKTKDEHFLTPHIEDIYQHFIYANSQIFKTEESIYSTRMIAQKALRTLNFSKGFSLQGACKNAILSSLASNNRSTHQLILIEMLPIPCGLKKILLEGLTQGFDSANCKIYKLLVAASKYHGWMYSLYSLD